MLSTKEKLELEIFAAEIRLALLEELKSLGVGHLGGSLRLSGKHAFIDTSLPGKYLAINGDTVTGIDRNDLSHRYILDFWLKA